MELAPKALLGFCELADCKVDVSYGFYHGLSVILPCWGNGMGVDMAWLQESTPWLMPFSVSTVGSTWPACPEEPREESIDAT